MCVATDYKLKRPNTVNETDTLATPTAFFMLVYALFIMILKNWQKIQGWIGYWTAHIIFFMLFNICIYGCSCHSLIDVLSCFEFKFSL